uniref:Phosphoadenosine phosphosulfate reductase n=1 Tax=Thermofilum pendens TaxID=2269 RepID=A0A7J3X587_THEPE
MMEYYPYFMGGRLAGFVRTFSDYLEVFAEGDSRYYLWEGDRGLPHSGGTAFFRAFYEPPLEPKISLVDPEERVARAAAAVGERLRGRHVLVDFSGGKDSTLNLLLVSLLSERVGFRVTPVYVHVPYLEPPSSVDHAERIAAKLGYHLEVVEASRSQMLFYLSREGLPRRGSRWCTSLKMRALREARRRLSPDYEARAERLAESGKRMERLSLAFSRSVYIAGKTLNLVYDLPALAVAQILREHDLVHPHYLDGLPRVSCSLCPYRSLYELTLSRAYPLEDEGLVEHAAYMQFRRLYSTVSHWEEFWSYALWRFPPSAAKWRLEEREATGTDEALALEEARSMFKSMWVAAPRLEVAGRV